MHNYDVQYELDGETEWERIEAADPGHVFAKAQEMFPEAKILKALRSGFYHSPECWTEYEPPPVRREIKPQPRAFSRKKTKANTATFPFYDQVKK
jgi:hypothetical protein